MFQEMMIELEKKNMTDYSYSTSDIYEITNKILTTISFYQGHCATPIVKIAKAFGFVLYQENISNNEYGHIYVGTEAVERYGKEKVIVVKSNISKFQQRYMVALQLGNYLLKHLGTGCNSNFQELLQDKQLERFVFGLLMPYELFKEQYLIASKSGNPMFVETYLSRYFEVPIGCVVSRIGSIT